MLRPTNFSKELMELFIGRKFKDMCLVLRIISLVELFESRRNFRNTRPWSKPPQYAGRQ